MSALVATRSGYSLLILLALLTVYIVWGSTYYGIRVAIETIPPFGMLALRFLTAGVLLYGLLRWRGAPGPTPLQWRNSTIIGVLLLGGGTGVVTLAERDVSSSVAAMVIAVSPLFASLFASLWGERTTGREWLGIAVGLLGILLLNLGDLRATPLGAVLLILAPIFWTFGSMWGRHLQRPKGLMGSAAEMITGGTVLLILSVLAREQWQTPSSASLWALVYLIFFGSMLAYSAYSYLLQHVRPAVATSYAYVNPVVAVALGVGVGGEILTSLGWAALLVILVGVALVAWPRRP